MRILHNKIKKKLFFIRWSTNAVFFYQLVVKLFILPLFFDVVKIVFKKKLLFFLLITQTFLLNFYFKYKLLKFFKKNRVPKNLVFYFFILKIFFKD